MPGTNAQRGVDAWEELKFEDETGPTQQVALISLNVVVPSFFKIKIKIKGRQHLSTNIQIQMTRNSLQANITLSNLFHHATVAKSQEDMKR